MKLSSKQRALLGVLSPGFGGTSLPDYMKPLLENGLASITLFGSNTPSAEAAANLIAEIRSYNPDCLVAIDEESGDVTRIWARSGSPYPSPYLLGRLGNAELTRQSFFAMGGSLKEVGIDITFGPVLDLTVNSQNPIVGVRSFGVDPELVAEHGRAAILGLQQAGIAATGKHFPGHGDTASDSHHNLPLVRRSLSELMERDLRPFIGAIQSGVNAIMVGHLLVPEVDSAPSSQSTVWIRDVLRGLLNFDGLVVTDALDMGALGGVPRIHESAIRAIRAGADLLCLSGLPDQEELVMRILNAGAEMLDEKDLSALGQSAQRVSASRAEATSLSPQEPVSSIDLQPGLEAHGELTVDPGDLAILTLEAPPTIASGFINWGLEPSFEALGHSSGEFDTAGSKVIQFRDAWRDDVILERLNLIKAEYPDAIFVDFGWPTYAFDAKNLVRAFGATKAHSDCVAKILLDFD